MQSGRDAQELDRKIKQTENDIDAKKEEIKILQKALREGRFDMHHPGLKDMFKLTKDREYLEKKQADLEKEMMRLNQEIAEIDREIKLEEVDAYATIEHDENDIRHLEREKASANQELRSVQRDVRKANSKEEQRRKAA